MTKHYSVRRSYTFSGSHNLEGRDLHEHIFKVDVIIAGSRKTFQSDFNKSMLINYFELDEIFHLEVKSQILDDKGTIVFPNSSCENIAEWIFDRLERPFVRRYKCALEAVIVDDGDIAVTLTSKA